ncbi:hypothetical protein CLV40_11951 [Actinokineospora auranticolor]|uniref:Uncharacterized protein n=1 Tax=Actinokineospora auranticolor TaxID=155976 RepID=A0A2S6GGY6_9PSEU|nr:hypothetical protein CLV40_11951 [Actinokineospora auranticolor]
MPSRMLDGVTESHPDDLAPDHPRGPGAEAARQAARARQVADLAAALACLLLRPPRPRSGGCSR